MRIPPWSFPKLPAWIYNMLSAISVIGVLYGAGAIWLHFHDKSIRDDDAKAQAYVVDSLKAARRVDTLKMIDTLVQQKSVVVTRTVTKLDTEWKKVPEVLQTKDDTAKALSELPVLRRETDSAIRSCTEFQSAFSLYRTACDSALAAKDGVYNDLKAKYDAEHPGWKGTAKEWVVRLLIGTAAYEAGKHLP